MSTMTTLQSSIALRDQMSSVLNTIDKNLVGVIKDMGVLRDTMEGEFTLGETTESITKTIDGLKAAIKEAEQLKNGIGAAEKPTGKLTNMVHRLSSALGLSRKRAEELKDPMDMVTSTATRMAVALGMFKAGKQAMSLSDQLVQIDARLQIMTGSATEAATLNDKIFASTERARGSYLDTADSVAKLGMQARNAFKNTDEIVAFSELLNKTFTISGTSASGIQSVMYNLTQAMSSGILRGQDLNSVMSNAPGIAKMIETYMGASEGSVRSLAEQGLISAEIVKNALFASSDDINAQFATMPMTFEQVWQSIKNQAIQAFQAIGGKLNELLNSDRFQIFVANLVSFLEPLANGFLWVMDQTVIAANFIADNWETLGPILLGIAIAYGAIKVAQLAAAAAQVVLNSAILTCPLTWIVLGLVAIVQMINRVAGTSYSAIGMITGSIAMLAAFINNIAAHVWNLVASLVEFIVNIVRDPAYAFEKFIHDILMSILNLIATVVDPIIAFINCIVDALNSVGAGLGRIQHNLSEELKEIKPPTTDVNVWQAPRMQQIKLDEAYNSGYNWGAGLSDKVGNLFNADPLSGRDSLHQSAFDASQYQLLDNVGGIKGDTGTMADSLEASEEELVYLRDIAEREAINRYTTSNLTVNYNATNKIETDWDADQAFEEFGERLSEACLVAAEGVW